MEDPLFKESTYNVLIDISWDSIASRLRTLMLSLLTGLLLSADNLCKQLGP